MGRSYELLRSQRNSCNLAIRRAGFRPEDFEWQPFTPTSGLDAMLEGADWFPEIAYVGDGNEGYFFRFLETSVTFCPGIDTHTETSSSPGFWPNTLALFEGWLMALRREIESPDLWKSVEAAGGPFALVLGVEWGELETEPPLSAEDANFIRNRLQAIEKFLVEGENRSRPEQEAIREEMRYLRSSVDRLGRRDLWKVVGGTLFQLVLALSLAPAEAQKLFGIAQDILVRLAGGMQHLIH